MLIDKIDNYLTSRPKDVRKKRCFHPSSLHKSAYELYYLYLNGDNSEIFPPQTLRIFDNGTSVHERIQFYLSDAGIMLQAEAPISHPIYEICGSADGIIQLNDKKYILEIKSINSWGFNKTNLPKPEHILQLNIYMFCLKIYDAILLYECKNDQKMKEFYITIDTTILHPVLYKIKYVQSCLAKNQAPPQSE